MFGRYERRHEALLSKRRFAKRILASLSAAALAEVLLIAAGAIGFHYFEKLSWLDAALNTAMAITGNGPPFQAQTNAGKVFQIVFSLFGVMVFVLILTAIWVPVFHRILHSFHVDADSDSH